MSTLIAATDVQFAVSAFAPLAIGFFGLGTGYLIYGPQELLGLPPRDRAVDVSTGIWGIWMPGFMQFLAGTYLWIGLAWFHSFREAPLYMAALAFTAYGVHWWAIGLTRTFGGDPRPAGFMSVAFTVLSVLGALVFFKASDSPVGILFVGLAGVYVSDFFASLGYRTVSRDGGPAVRERTSLGELGERSLGVFHLATGGWLMYLTFAATVNASLGWTWWL